MELGPFSINEVESVKEIFISKKVPFEMLIDEDMRDQEAPRGMAGQLDLKFVFFEISDSDFEKVKSHLEKYAIMELSDGSYELGEE